MKSCRARRHRAPLPVLQFRTILVQGPRRHHLATLCRSVDSGRGTVIFPRAEGSVFVSQLGKGGSWEFKRQAGSILGVGNLGALGWREELGSSWELGSRHAIPF